MEAAAPPAFQNFGALVFRDHTLHLKQEIVLRGAADRAVQENDLSPRATKLIDHEHLMGVTTGEPIRSVDINRSICPPAIASRNRSRAGRARMEPL